MALVDMYIYFETKQFFFWRQVHWGMWACNGHFQLHIHILAFGWHNIAKPHLPLNLARRIIWPRPGNEHILMPQQCHDGTWHLFCLQISEGARGLVILWGSQIISFGFNNCESWRLSSQVTKSEWRCKINKHLKCTFFFLFKQSHRSSQLC